MVPISAIITEDPEPNGTTALIASASTGTTREFVTTKLAAGQSWDNYTIRVEFERNGQTISKSEKISLAAGDTREVTIDVDGAQVAKATTGSDIQ